MGYGALGSISDVIRWTPRGPPSWEPKWTKNRQKIDPNRNDFCNQFSDRSWTPLGPIFDGFWTRFGVAGGPFRIVNNGVRSTWAHFKMNTWKYRQKRPTWPQVGSILDPKLAPTSMQNVFQHALKKRMQKWCKKGHARRAVNCEKWATNPWWGPLNQYNQSPRWGILSLHFVHWEARWRTTYTNYRRCNTL